MLFVRMAQHHVLQTNSSSSGKHRSNVSQFHNFLAILPLSQYVLLHPELKLAHVKPPMALWTSTTHHLLQIQSVNYFNTYSHVVKSESPCTILALTTCYDWEVVSLDFNVTCLNSTLNDNEETYMQEPPGYEMAQVAQWPRSSLYSLKHRTEVVRRSTVFPPTLGSMRAKPILECSSPTRAATPHPFCSR